MEKRGSETRSLEEIAVTGESLKATLWKTIHEIRDKSISKENADKVAQLAREIVRTTNSELQIIKASHYSVTPNLLRFASVEEARVQ